MIKVNRDLLMKSIYSVLKAQGATCKALEDDSICIRDRRQSRFSKLYFRVEDSKLIFELDSLVKATKALTVTEDELNNIFYGKLSLFVSWVERLLVVPNMCFAEIEYSQKHLKDKGAERYTLMKVREHFLKIQEGLNSSLTQGEDLKIDIHLGLEEAGLSIRSSLGNRVGVEFVITETDFTFWLSNTRLFDESGLEVLQLNKWKSGWDFLAERPGDVVKTLLAFLSEADDYTTPHVCTRNTLEIQFPAK